MGEQEAAAEIQAETPDPTPPPAPEPTPEEPDQVVQEGEIALPREGKVRVIRPEPYTPEPENEKERKDRVELA